MTDNSHQINQLRQSSDESIQLIGEILHRQEVDQNSLEDNLEALNADHNLLADKLSRLQKLVEK